MTEISCPNCHSDDPVENSLTNAAQKYYCRNCETPFNPQQIPCPSCEAIESVGQNSFDDPRDYYCYECNMVFDRLGPSFEPSEIEYGALTTGFETSTKSLSLDVIKTTETPNQRFEYALENTGEEPVVTQGRWAIAVQKRVTEDDWWTILGNPQRFSPDEQIELPPGETLEWEIVFSHERLTGPGFEINHRFADGEFRVIYWGIPKARTVLGVRQDIDVGWKR